MSFSLAPNSNEEQGSLPLHFYLILILIGFLKTVHLFALDIRILLIDGFCNDFLGFANPFCTGAYAKKSANRKQKELPTHIGNGFI